MTNEIKAFIQALAISIVTAPLLVGTLLSLIYITNQF